MHDQLLNNTILSTMLYYGNNFPTPHWGHLLCCITLISKNRYLLLYFGKTFGTIRWETNYPKILLIVLYCIKLLINNINIK